MHKKSSIYGTKMSLRFPAKGRNAVWVFLPVLALLGACDRMPDAPAPAAARSADVRPKAVTADKPLETALMAIPPQLRAAHQQALACEVKRNNARKGATAIDVTPAYLQDLLARLRADPGIAKC